MELGLDVPRDVSVVGFDDIPAAESSSPGLSAVHQPLTEKGVVATDLLVRALAGDEGLGPQVELLPTSLLVACLQWSRPDAAATPTAQS